MTFPTDPAAHVATKRLTDLALQEPARIAGFSCDDPELETRLREIGFAEGDPVTPLHRGLFGRNPMSVKLGGATIAIRREDAAAILVEAVSS